MSEFEVTLKLCTLLKGVPIGPAIINYTHKNSEKKYLSFEGVGIFHEGKLHKGPFTALDGVGDGRLFSFMKNGRPADSYYSTRLFGSGYKRNIETLETLTQVDGM